ncbi:hypothetical protein PFISCL1PPCAC_24188, partial [Pristionchus fissidentatus]
LNSSSSSSSSSSTSSDSSIFRPSPLFTTSVSAVLVPGALFRSVAMFPGRLNSRAKPFTLNCTLLLLVFGYAFAGGLVFDKLEREALRTSHEEERKAKVKCAMMILMNTTVRAAYLTAETVADCFTPPRDIRSEWSFVTATLYGFGVVTTLGYNRIAPITYAGRLFCIVYGICGIPFTMIIIANVGQYLNQFAGDSRRRIEEYRERRRRSRASLTGREIEDSPIQIASLALLVVFLLYVALGALLLPALNGEIDFFNGLYYNFLCLTAIDFGQLVPSRVAFLPITFLYVVLGLAITTIAIDIGSEYLKKLHNLGKRVKNAAQTKIWFGGKKLKVRELLHAVGKKCGVDASVIDALDLENVVERTIAFNEGREPPPDTNIDSESCSRCSRPPSPPGSGPPSSGRGSSPADDIPFITITPKMSRPASLRQPPTRRISPELIIKNPVFQSTSDVMHSPVEEVRPKPDFVSVSMPEESIVEDPFTRPEEAIVVPPPEILDKVLIESVLVPSPPPVIVELPPSPLVCDAPEDLPPRPRTTSPEDTNTVPRKFREKKERYGRDPKLLFETYQEEWARIAHLSEKNSPRRKSVINLSHSSNNLAG